MTAGVAALLGASRDQTGRAPAGAQRAVVLIDGRSGSGKSVAAGQVAAELGAAVLSLEDLYPGWDGLAAGSAAVPGALQSGRYRPYDWQLGRFADQERTLPRGPLVIEGCGALTAENLSAAHRWAAEHRLPGGAWAVWLDVPAVRRKSRALAREGEIFAPHWDQWAAQEEAHFQRHRPWELADHVSLTR